jgi:magnesium-transporting ATPase (P-type)
MSFKIVWFGHGLIYSYWHMGIVSTSVNMIVGLTISFINYYNAIRIQQLCIVEQSVEAIRNQQIMTVVPGHVIVLRSSGGIMYCDAIVLTSGEVIVDESSLTGE